MTSTSIDVRSLALRASFTGKHINAIKAFTGAEILVRGGFDSLTYVFVSGSEAACSLAELIVRDVLADLPPYTWAVQCMRVCVSVVHNGIDKFVYIGWEGFSWRSNTRLATAELWFASARQRRPAKKEELAAAAAAAAVPIKAKTESAKEGEKAVEEDRPTYAQIVSKKATQAVKKEDADVKAEARKEGGWFLTGARESISKSPFELVSHDDFEAAYTVVEVVKLASEHDSEHENEHESSDAESVGPHLEGEGCGRPCQSMCVI